jgi:hypothetical protein
MSRTRRGLGTLIGTAILLCGTLLIAQEPAPPNTRADQPTAKPLDGGGAAAEGPASDKTAAEPATKVAPPAAADETTAAKEVRDVYGEEYAKAKDADSKAKFASRLLQEARATQDNSAARYVMMKVSRDISAQSGDLETALRTSDEIAEIYQVDAVKMKMEIVEKAAKTARLPAQSRTLAERALTLMDDAAGHDDFDSARRLGDLAAEEAHKSHDASLLAAAQSRAENVDKLAKAYADVKAANEVLEKNPTDPQANLAVGKHLCLVKGDWEQGVPMLALCGDAGLKAAAEKDIAADKDAKAKLPAGDAWWELAEKEQGLVRDQMRQRAVAWYRQAQPSATGLAAVKIEKRIHEVEQAAASAASTAAAGREAKKRRTFPGRIFACGRDSYMIYINGQEALQGGPELATKDFNFSQGDVITVMAVSSPGSVKGFCCVIRFMKGGVMTGAAWKGYTPPSEAQWYQPGKAPQTYPVVQGDVSPKETTDRVFKAAGVRAPAIWGRGQTCYLTFVIK